jgi:antirestriction protein ArdC
MQFCTYHQVNSIGASVRKGEKASHIIFTKHFTKKDEETGEDKPGTVVKGYPVFNLDQLEKVPEKYLVPQEPEPTQVMTYTNALAIVKASGIKVKDGGNKAAYYPGGDEIVMPYATAFVDEEAYWQTFNHELTHGTGHRNRLHRIYGTRFGDANYAFEELVAELGSAFLCARLGIPAGFRSSSYIDSWLKVLKGDNRAILSAASYAGQAADWLWNRAFPPAEQDKAA